MVTYQAYEDGPYISQAVTSAVTPAVTPTVTPVTSTVSRGWPPPLTEAYATRRWQDRLRLRDPGVGAAGVTVDVTVDVTAIVTVDVTASASEILASALQV